MEKLTELREPYFRFVEDEYTEDSEKRALERKADAAPFHTVTRKLLENAGYSLGVPLRHTPQHFEWDCSFGPCAIRANVPEVLLYSEGNVAYYEGREILRACKAAALQHPLYKG